MVPAHHFPKSSPSIPMLARGGARQSPRPRGDLPGGTNSRWGSVAASALFCSTSPRNATFLARSWRSPLRRDDCRSALAILWHPVGACFWAADWLSCEALLGPRRKASAVQDLRRLSRGRPDLLGWLLDQQTRDWIANRRTQRCYQ